jgi:CO/xanthine dehydrogenase Mo-binding subunit
MHGWTEMGQGVDTVLIQIFCKETKIDPGSVSISVETNANLPTGMTTSSRATVLAGNAMIDASRKLKKDLVHFTLAELAGKTYVGSFRCDWTTKPGQNIEKPVTHFSYGYASQVVILDDRGRIVRVVAAHDAGSIINPELFEGQIQGSVHMGLGYALSEDLPMKGGFLISDKIKDLGIFRAGQMPEVIVKGIGVKDSVGPYGAKGVGEIGMVPTAAAVANALYQFEKKRKYHLPLSKKVGQ